MEKLGRIFRPQNYGLDYAQAPSAVQMDGFVRVYFTHRKRKGGLPISLAGYADFDENWKVIRANPGPLVPLGKTGTFDEFGTYPVSVIKDIKRYVMFYAGWTRLKSVPFNVSIGMAIGDGKRFTKIGEGPILTQSLHEPYLIGGPKIRKFKNKFHLFYIAGTKWIKDKPIYKIKLAEKELIRGKENECQAGPDVHYANGKYHMYFSYRDYDKANYRIGYAFSEDLLNWTRKDPKIELSKKGWDSQMHHYPHVFGKYMLYNGNKYGKYGFGLIHL